LDGGQGSISPHSVAVEHASHFGLMLVPQIPDYRRICVLSTHLGFKEQGAIPLGAVEERVDCLIVRSDVELNARDRRVAVLARLPRRLSAELRRRDDRSDDFPLGLPLAQTLYPYC